MSPFNAKAPVLDTYQAVVSAYSDFLIVAIHTILYERKIYPEISFIKTRTYNHPVRQNRHPKVCKWIQHAVSAVEVEMLKVVDFQFHYLASSAPSSRRLGKSIASSKPRNMSQQIPSSKRMSCIQLSYTFFSIFSLPQIQRPVPAQFHLPFPIPSNRIRFPLPVPLSP